MSTQGDKLKAIADAIRAKEGSSDPIAANDFPARIAAIETGVQLPTLSNPGSSADIARGKQLIDQNGEIVTGSVQTWEDGYGSSLDGTQVSMVTDSLGGRYVSTYGTFSSNRLYRPGSTISVDLDPSAYGDATAADVASGKTFTSSAGVKISGTRVETPPVFYTVVQPSSPGYQIGGLDLYNYPYNVMPKLISIFSLTSITFYSNTFDSLVLLNGVGGFYSGRSIRGTINSADIVFEEIQDLDTTKFVVQKGSNSISIRLPGSGSRFFFFDGGIQYVVAIGV